MSACTSLSVRLINDIACMLRNSLSYVLVNVCQMGHAIVNLLFQNAPYKFACTNLSLSLSLALSLSLSLHPSLSPSEYKIIIVGLDNAGKTTILYQL